MKTIKIFNKLVNRYIEYPDDSELTNKETVEMPLDEYINKNYGSHIKVKTISELTPEEKYLFNHSIENENDINS